MFEMIMYVDDTTLLYDLSNDHDIETLLNNELCKITDWLWFFTLIEDVLYTQS